MLKEGEIMTYDERINKAAEICGLSRQDVLDILKHGALEEMLEFYRPRSQWELEGINRMYM